MLLASLLASLFLQAAPPRADTAAVPADIHDATARVTFDFGTGAGAPVVVHGFEFQVSNTGTGALPPAPTPAAQLMGAAQVRFERLPGLYSPDLAQHSASGERIPSVTIDVLGAGGDTVMVLHLGDVLVANEHIIVNDRSGLQEQRLGILDGIAQTTADLQEAQRQQNLTEALDKKRLTSSLEVARVRSQVEMLEKRLDIERGRLSMLEAQVAAIGALDEQVTLAFAHFDLQTPGSVAVSFDFAPPPSVPRPSRVR